MSPLIVLMLCIPPFIIAIALLISGYRRKVKERKGCEQLLALVKATEEEQKQAIQKYLNKSLGFDGSAATGKADELMKLRKQFMRKLLLGFLHRDVLLIASLDNELSQLTNAYHRLEGKANAAAVPATQKQEGAEPQVMQLQQDNQRLRHEIHITLSTLNNIFAEYSSMFGNDEGARNLSVAQIVDKMQQLSGGGDEAQMEQAARDDVTGAGDSLASANSESKEAEPVLDPFESGDIIADAAASLDGGGIDPSWEDAFSEAAKQNEQ